tara:strand:+ start:177 stop:464 length:288 start_codon:yes stop_codon:yes gene_type:complete
MIAKLAQKILRLIMPQIIEHLLKIFKMDKLLDYMEKPNELDSAVDEIKIEQEAIKGFFEGFQKQLDDINNKSKETERIIKKIKNKKIFKSLNAKK